jgi:hypothetical protein
LRRRLVLRSGISICSGSGILKLGYADDLQKRLSELIRRTEYPPEAFLAYFAYTCVPEVFFPLGFNQARFSFSTLEDPDVPQDLVGLSGDITEKVNAKVGRQLTKPMPHVGYLCDKCRQAVQMMCSPLGTQFRDETGTWHGFEYCLGKLLEDSSGKNNMATEEWCSLFSQKWRELNSTPREQ